MSDWTGCCNSLLFFYPRPRKKTAGCGVDDQHSFSIHPNDVTQLGLWLNDCKNEKICHALDVILYAVTTEQKKKKNNG